MSIPHAPSDSVQRNLSSMAQKRGRDHRPPAARHDGPTPLNMRLYSLFFVHALWYLQSSGISSFGALMLLAPIVWILTIAICVCFAGKFWWFPAPISAHGEAYDQQFTITLAVTGVIFFAPQMALGYASLRFRACGGRADYSAGNNKLAGLWTSAGAVLFVGLVLMGTRIWAGVHFEQAPPDAVEVQVLAKQFAWSFRYAGPDGKYGRTDIKF